MMDILTHPLTVFGNIENTLWFSEPFSCGAGYGNFGSGWFFLKGILDLEDVGVRNGWQSNLRLFFLVSLQGEGWGPCCKAVRKKCFRM